MAAFLAVNSGTTGASATAGAGRASFMKPDDFYADVGIVATLATGMTAIWLFILRVLKPIWSGVLRPTGTFFYNVGAMPAIVAALQKDLNHVSDQLRTNGGASMLDAVKRIDGNMKKVALISDLHSRVLNIARWESDKDGYAIWSSDVMLTMTGRNFDEIQNMNWTNLYPERERDRVIKLWMLSVTQRSPFEIDSWYVRKDGTELAVHVYAEPIDNKDRETGWVGYAMVRK